MLRFWDLAPSPNNIKVRMALRFKEVPFETIPVDPMDRSALVEVSGQELSPVIEDRGIVLNDSEGILQYLDANYRASRRLFPATRQARQECEGWKGVLDKKLVPRWLPIFLFGIGRRAELEPGAQEGFREGLEWLENELGDADTFKGEEMSICDLRVAEWATYALPGEELIQRVPLFRRFKEHYGVPDDALPRLRRFMTPWNERLR